MALADRYIKPDTRTKFEKWLDSLSPRNLEIVQGWLTDLSISNVKILGMIADDDPEDDFKGYRATKDTIAAWRRAHVHS